MDGAVAHPVEDGRRVPGARVRMREVAQAFEDPDDAFALTAREDASLDEQLEAHALADRVGGHAQVGRPHRHRHPESVAAQRGREFEHLVPRRRHRVVAEPLVDRGDLRGGVDGEGPLVTGVRVAGVARADTGTAALGQNVLPDQLVQRLEGRARGRVSDERVVDDQEVV